jgi:hypothetical protein
VIVSISYGLGKSGKGYVRREPPVCIFLDICAFSIAKSGTFFPNIITAGVKFWDMDFVWCWLTIQKFKDMILLVYFGMVLDMDCHQMPVLAGQPHQKISGLVSREEKGVTFSDRENPKYSTSFQSPSCVLPTSGKGIE